MKKILVSLNFFPANFVKLCDQTFSVGDELSDHSEVFQIACDQIFIFQFNHVVSCSAFEPVDGKSNDLPPPATRTEAASHATTTTSRRTISSRTPRIA